MDKQEKTFNAKAINRMPDASALIRKKSVYGPELTIDQPWAKTQGPTSLQAAVEKGQLTKEQAAKVTYGYFPQPDGTLFCSIAIHALPGILLGSTVPKGAWHMRAQ